MPRSLCTAALLLSVVCAQTVYSETPARRTAPLMPLAAKSLLLDVTTAGDRLVAAGERGHVLYSDDAGNHWQQASVPTTQMLTAVYFVNDRLGWSVGHDGLILTSDDGGATWRIQRDGLAVQHQQNIEQREGALRRLRALQAERDAAAPDTPQPALESAVEDAQMDLEDAELALDEPVFTAPLLDVWFEDENRGWAVGAFGTLVATSDGGQHWSDHSERLDNPDEFHLNAIIGDGRGRVFIAGEGGVIFRSDDSGATWESIEPFYEGSWFGLVYEPVSETLLVFGLRGNLFRSADFGRSFERESVDTHISLAGGGSDGNGRVVIAGGVGTVLYSPGGGRNFRRSMLADRLSLSSGIPRDGNLILVGQGGARVYEVQQ